MNKMMTMNKTLRIKRRIMALSLISTFLLTGVYSIILLNPSNTPLNKLDDVNDDVYGRDFMDSPKLSVYGDHPWWNRTYNFRQLINVTNPYDVSLDNYGVSIEFDYTTKNMSDTLQDLRIIEYKGNTPHIRKYYFQIDYPSVDLATVWFETNISASTTEFDTYLYYGNDDVWNDTTYFMDKVDSASVADNIGWIKNGGFEQDIDDLYHRIDSVFGWYYADDVPDSIAVDLTGGTITPKNETKEDKGGVETWYTHGLTDDDDGQEEIGEGTYAFKWGNALDSIASGGGEGKDCVGTLYSTPFLVPEVSGDIGINVWRNIRTYDKKRDKYGTYFAVVSDPSQGDFADVNTHEEFFYEEAWNSIIEEVKDPVPLHTWVWDTDPSEISDTDGDPLGVLGGSISIDVSAYKGDVIFLEFGFVAKTGWEKDFRAFGQIDDVRFNYTLQTGLNEDVQEKVSATTIIVKDVDGRIVPNAEVSLINSSLANPILETKISSEDGTVLFSGLDWGVYNITANYTTGIGIESVVYDSSVIGERNFTIDESVENFEITLNIWSIDFEMVDYDKEPLNYGYIEVYNTTKGGTFLDNLTLDVDGKSIFRWKNQSSYYYEVYYDNIDYSLNPTLLNESWIQRDTYDQLDDKYRLHSFFINQTNTDPPGNPTFAIDELFYTDGSTTELGNKKILDANINITFQSSLAYLTEVSIYYIDQNNYTDNNYLIYYNNSYDADFLTNRININMREPQLTPSNLIANNYDVYGLRIVAIGANTTNNNGIFNISLTETTNIYNVTDLVKMNVRVIDTVGNGVVGVLVKVNSSGGFAVDLETRDSPIDTLKGYAYGQTNTQLPLWYLRGKTYNFSLEFFGSHKDLIVNESDQWKPSTNVFYYNYTPIQKSNITFELYFGVGVNVSWFQTAFKNINVNDSVVWGENMTIQVNFTLTEDITFNSSVLSASGRGRLYSFILSGAKTGFSSPSNATGTFFISAIPTALTMHDYDDSLNLITETSQRFGELMNLTFSYYNNDTLSPLKDATFTYEWLNLDPVQFYADPINEGYYTATIDTSLAEIWGIRSIIINAQLENHTTQTLLTSISIMKRLTSLNNETDLVYISSKVWVQKAVNFTFSYKDILSDSMVGALDIASFTWQELYENGTIISGIDGSGTLMQNMDNTYTLDFKTELKPIGYYFLYVTLHKENYESKSALISLELILREFDADIDIENLAGNQVDVVQGSDVNLEISLIDLTRGNIPLENVSVYLSIGGNEYPFIESSPGTYSLVFETEHIEAFFAPNLLAGIIYLNIENFTSQQVGININVQMEEIFPGVSAFYFILISAAIIGVVGSLITYRVVQQARIPKFVKKVRKVKGSIKSKKTISESLKTKTKDQMMVKLYGDDWKELELSLEDNLGIVDLKLKPIPLKEKKSKKGGYKD